MALIADQASVVLGWLGMCPPCTPLAAVPPSRSGAGPSPGPVWPEGPPRRETALAMAAILQRGGGRQEGGGSDRQTLETEEGGQVPLPIQKSLWQSGASSHRQPQSLIGEGAQECRLVSNFLRCICTLNVLGQLRADFDSEGGTASHWPGEPNPEPLP